MKHLSPLENQPTKWLNSAPYQGFVGMEIIMMKTRPSETKKIYFPSSNSLFFLFFYK
ncbi:hypothetical protein BAME_27190 [Bacillus sp. M 2-6]|nr:hypothetical protein BAME_27190 [Bacillus sp. M 2-6]